MSLHSTEVLSPAGFLVGGFCLALFILVQLSIRFSTRFIFLKPFSFSVPNKYFLSRKFTFFSVIHISESIFIFECTQNFGLIFLSPIILIDCWFINTFNN